MRRPHRPRGLEVELARDRGRDLATDPFADERVGLDSPRAQKLGEREADGEGRHVSGLVEATVEGRPEDGLRRIELVARAEAMLRKREGDERLARLGERAVDPLDRSSF